MFPMNDTLRKQFDTQADLAHELTGQAMEWQSTMMLAGQKQFNAMFDGYRNILEANHKAARAMQQSMMAPMRSETAGA